MLVKIQKVFRGWRIRKAMYSWYRDYWEKFIDESTDTAYYYNTWSQETVWYEPFEYVLSNHLRELKQRRKLAGDVSSLVHIEKKLPDGWIRKKDPKTKLTYFYHEGDHEYRWEKPLRREEKKTVMLLNSNWFNRQEKEVLIARSTRKRAIGMWLEMRDSETSATFYYQPITQEARWSLSPRSASGEGLENMRLVTSVKNTNEDGDISGWITVVDPDGGGVYYYNEFTGESTWDAPQAIQLKEDKFKQKEANETKENESGSAKTEDIPINE